MERLTDNTDYCKKSCGYEMPEVDCVVFECYDRKIYNKLREYEDAEEQGMLISLPDSDWKHLIEQINVIVTNDFIVYKERAEFVISDIYMIGWDEEFRFKAECRCFHSEGEYWECDRYEECNIGKDDYPAEKCGCIICFGFSEIGKSVFLTKEEAEAALAEMEK